MVNGPPCAVCGFTLRWLPQQNGWGCDRCQRMFPASGPGAPQPQAAPSAWAPPAAAQPYQQQGFGRPPQQQQPSYPPQAQPQWQQPPQQQPYGQQPPNPYAQQPQGYGAPPQQAYSPHPSHPPQPVAPVATPGGKKGGKGLIIGGAIAAVAIAGGVVAFVMLRGGGGTKGGDGRDAVVKSTLAALGAGDVDQMMNLADYPGLWAKVVDCSGKTPPRDKSDLERDKDEDEDKDKDKNDPKKMAEKQRKTLETDVLPLTKGAKIELVEITSKVPGPPKDKRKDDDDDKSDDEEKDDEDKGFTLPVGSRMGKGCYSKVPMRFHQAKIKVKVTPKGEEPIEQNAKVGMLQVGNGFWLVDPPHLNLGVGALARELTAMKEKVCKCEKAECASKLKEEFKDGPRYEEIDKQIDKLSDEDRKKIDAIEDEIKACERKLEGGEQLAAFESFKNKICSCVDKACVDKVSQEMTVYAKTHSSDKLSDEDMKKGTAIGEAMAKCMAKIDEAERMRNPPPDTGSGGGIGSTIGEATGAGDAPPACIEYEKVLDKLLTCPKFPKNQHQSIEEQRKALQMGYKDYKRLPKASQKTIDDACTQGIEGMTQALKAMGC